MEFINKVALKNSILTALYVIGVATFMYLGASAKIGQSNTILVPITFLMLFVTSAAVTGFLMFGQPIQMYLDGKKKEAMSLVTHTLIYFSVITFTAITLLVFFTK
jgi:hypothetical protein